MPALASSFMHKGMQESCDVAVIGGAFSGAATAITASARSPELRVVVIERSERFDRKVGEATTEGERMFPDQTRQGSPTIFAIIMWVKNGLRFWFSAEGPDDDFDRCGELGAFYQVRLPSYQVDREVLMSEHVLSLAAKAGAIVWRPQRSRAIEVVAGPRRHSFARVTGNVSFAAALDHRRERPGGGARAPVEPLARPARASDKFHLGALSQREGLGRL